MIKQGVLQSNSSTVSVIQRSCDFFIVIASLLSVFWIDSLSWGLHGWFSLLTCLFLFQLLSEAVGVYRSWRGVGFLREVQQVLVSWFFSCVAFSLAKFYLPAIPVISAETIVKWFVFAAIGLVVFRLAERFCLNRIRSLGYNTRLAAVVGVNPIAIHLAEQLQSSPWLGIRVAGFYDDVVHGEVKVNQGTVKVLGELEQLVGDAKGGRLDRIYIALPMAQDKRIKYLVSQLSDTTCSVLLIPDIFTFNLLHARSIDVNGIPLISIFDTPLFGWNAAVKRAEDFVLALLILILISPVLLVISMLVKYTSPGPIIFKQKRYGIDGRPISVWKFRSMKVMENGAKVVQATKNDCRFTPIGAFLRKSSLDELPQFVNVLQGNMSIVGPRPHAVAHNEEYRKVIQGYMLRHKVKPGITGWAQINGWRGETDTLEKMEKRIEYDLEYIRNWSLWLDLKIVFFTIFKGFINKNAY